MRALVPLGEKSSESVPEMVFPYRHIDNGCIRQIKNFLYLGRKLKNVVESSRLIDTVNSNNSAILVENRSFQIVPKQEGVMNTQSKRYDIYP